MLYPRKFEQEEVAVLRVTEISLNVLKSKNFDTFHISLKFDVDYYFRACENENIVQLLYQHHKGLETERNPGEDLV